MYLPRIIIKNLKAALAEKSVLLLGPRQTGKSSLLREEIRPDRAFNLLDQTVFLGISRRLSSLRESLRPTDRLIVIDEIQKLPQLMDEVHLMIEEQGRRFVLTGSSARKLRRSYTKLMAGRTRSLTLHPFVSAELGARFDLERALGSGTMPSIYLSDNPYANLLDYTGDYLQQEIAAEAMTRNVDHYARFLTQIARRTAQVLNIERLASDAQVSPSTARRFLDILKDTLIAEQLECWSRRGQHKAPTATKLVFFDVGIVNALIDVQGYSPRSPNAGWQLEQFIGQELLAYRDYAPQRSKLQYWRTYQGDEVDYIVDECVALEVKHTEQVSKADLKGLLALGKQGKWRRKIVVSRDPMPRRMGDIEILPVPVFLEMLWSGELSGGQ